MKINTKIKIKELSGEEAPLTIGEAISHILISSDASGKMKLFILAQDFYQKETIDIDKVDLDIVKNAIEKSTAYKVLVTGQLLVILRDLEKVEEAPKK